MAPLGKVEEYYEKAQNFESYLELFEHFVTANAVQADKKLALIFNRKRGSSLRSVKKLGRASGAGRQVV